MRRLGTLLAVLALAAATLAAETFDIVRMDVGVTVSETGVATVSESMIVDFHEPSRGIWRDIPAHGAEIADINANTDTLVQESGGLVSVRLGDGDELVEGPVEYNLRYTIDPGIDQNPNYDIWRLDFFEVQGGYSVSNLSFSVAFPTKLEGASVEAYAGPIGSDETIDLTINEGRICVGGPVDLESGEAATISAVLPDGYFTRADYSAIGWTAVVVLTLLCVGLLSWWMWRHGRDTDPEREDMQGPPEGMTPLEVGYLYDSFAGNSDYSSMILHWASEGLVEIEDDGEDLVFRKKGELLSGSPEFEKELFSSLFAKGDEVKSSDQGSLAGTQAKVAKLLEKRYSTGERALYDPKSMKYAFASLVVTGVYCLASSFAVAVNDIPMFLLSFLVSAAQVIITGLLFWNLLRRVPTLKARVFHWLIAFVVTLMAVGAQQGICASAGMNSAAARGVSLLFSVGVTVLTRLTVGMPRRSAYCQKVLGEIMGYRDWLSSGDLSGAGEGRFLSNLAYAQALGLDKTWAERCSGLFSASAPWLICPPGTDLNWLYYSSLCARSRRAWAVSNTPESSASSGPGPYHGGTGSYSGGGMGGGGARSW